MSEKLSSEALANSINTTFRMSSDSLAPVDIELVEFKPGKSIPTQEQFALLFRAPREAPAEQGTFKMQHHALGEFDLFLVPVRRDADNLYYEAVFNRLLD
jgi:hypothetical protein